MLSIYMPSTLFEVGGKFEGKNPGSIQITVPLSHQQNKALRVSTGPITLEDWEFQPKSNHDYHDILELVRSGLIIIERDTVVQTPANLIDLFRENYQEL